MKKVILIISLIFFFEFTNCVKTNNLRLTASDLFGNLASVLAAGGASSNGSTILNLDGTLLGQATNSNNASTSLSNKGVAGIAANTGLSASTSAALGTVKTATSGNNSVALGTKKAVTATDAQGANVIDILSGTATSGTISGTNSTVKVGNNAASEASNASTLGTVTGDGVLAAATDSTGASLAPDQMAASSNTNNVGGLLAVNSGSGNLSVASNHNGSATLGGSSASTSSSTTGNVSITGSGTGSTTSSTTSSVVITNKYSI